MEINRNLRHYCDIVSGQRYGMINLLNQLLFDLKMLALRVDFNIKKM